MDACLLSFRPFSVKKQFLHRLAALSRDLRTASLPAFTAAKPVAMVASAAATDAACAICVAASTSGEPAALGVCAPAQRSSSSAGKGFGGASPKPFSIAAEKGAGCSNGQSHSAVGAQARGTGVDTAALRARVLSLRVQVTDPPEPSPQTIIKPPGLTEWKVT